MTKRLQLLPLAASTLLLLCTDTSLALVNEDSEFEGSTLHSTATLIISEWSSGRATSPLPCPCSRHFRPVCGSDGQTYDNFCILRCRARRLDIELRRAYKGACCPADAACPPHKDPLCDSEGNTHLNDCVFERAKCLRKRVDGSHLAVVHRGSCGVPKQLNDACDLVTVDTPCSLEPTKLLCDANGMTHPNLCSYERANCLHKREVGGELSIAHFGVCGRERGINGDLRFSPPSLVRAAPASLSELNSDEDSITVSELDRIIVGSEETVVQTAETPLPFIADTHTFDVIESANQTEEANATSTNPEQSFSDLDASDDITRLLGSALFGGAMQQLKREETYSDPENSTTPSLPSLLFDSGRSSIVAEIAAAKKEASLAALASQFEIAFSLDDDTTYEGSGSAGELLNIDAPISEQVVLTSTQPCSAVECSKHWEPVCDTAGQTHRNLCLLEFHACVSFRKRGKLIALAHHGECDQDEKTGSPCSQCGGHGGLGSTGVAACDNHNQTHHSLDALAILNCELRRAGKPAAVLIHLGECHQRSLSFAVQDEQCPSKCKRDYKPVCDSSGRTHSNLCSYQRSSCLARKARAPFKAYDLAYLDECGRIMEETETEQISELPDHLSLPVASLGVVSPPITTMPAEQPATQAHPNLFTCPQPICPTHGQPVCDNLGNVHENTCQFNWARCLAAQHGIILALQPDELCSLSGCNLVCDNEEEPICGSDFVTYRNLCHYRKARCVQSRLEQLFRGNCSICFAAPCAELSQDAPENEFVCDHNGVTRSKCEFNMLKCVLENNFGYSLRMRHEGRCCSPASACKKVSEFVCGTDHVTYPNNCTLEAATCTNRKSNSVLIVQFAHNGTCAPANASAWSPAVASTPSPTLHDSNYSANHAASSVPPMKTSTDTPSRAPLSASSTVATPLPDKEETLLPSIDDIAGREKTTDADPSLACPPDDCPESDKEPVCASDGKTYSNLCALKQARCDGLLITALYGGECCTASCPADFDPVCDSDGRTHHNLCLFGVHRCEQMRSLGRTVEIVSFKMCMTEKERACNASCPSVYEPVCGDNGETFSSDCVLNKYNCLISHNITSGAVVTKDYNGSCCSTSFCNATHFAPVCDSDGVTHANECLLQHHQCTQQRRTGHQVTMKYKGQCCSQPCEDRYEPVCDGRSTHSNLCSFRVAQCIAERDSGRQLTLAYPGECCAAPKGACAQSGAVCDSDGQTHANTCQFEQKKCILERNGLKQITTVHTGECCKIEQCHKGAQPVCDNRGGTHASLCHFKNTKCISDKVHANATIELAYEGPCCPANCPTQLAPVCDQHGSVYRNACLFRLRACEMNRTTGADLLLTPCPDRRARHLAAAALTATKPLPIPLH